MESGNPRTLVELFLGAVSAAPDRQAVRYKQDRDWVGISCHELRQRVCNLALGLHQQGIRKGDRVAILAESGLLWTVTDYAILSIGAINVPIYPTQPTHQVEYILSESEPSLLVISTARQFKRVGSVLKKFTKLPIVPFQPMPAVESAIQFTSLEEAGAALAAELPELFDQLANSVEAEDLASIIYTSGTTGEPKGVMLTHSNITFNAVTAGAFLEIEPDSRMLSFLPLSHVFERMVLYLCLHRGVEINYAGGIETVVNDIRQVHPSLMSTVPRLIEKIYSRMQKTASGQGKLKKRIFEWSLDVARRAAPARIAGRKGSLVLELQWKLADRFVFAKLREAVGGRIKRMVSGGAALPRDLALIFNGAGVPVLQGYGMTETSPVIAVNTLRHNRVGTVGQPLPGIEIRIAEDGEILTRGPHVFRGYFKKPQETEEAFEAAAPGEQHWLKTGDIGHLDGDGFLTITDRKKDLIKTSAGKYVAPQMLEGRLGQSEFIEQAVVVGDNRKYIAALIVPEFEHVKDWATKKGIPNGSREAMAGDARVVELIKGEVSRLTTDLADYEKVKRIALMANEFTIDGGEITPTLKVRRAVIREKYGDLIESLYPPGSE